MDTMNLKTEIDTLLDGYEKKLTEKEEQDRRNHDQYLKQKEKTLKIGKELIIPSMNKIGKILKERSHDYKINENLDDSMPVVTMIIYPKPYNQKQSIAMPEITFILGIGEGTVRILYYTQWFNNPVTNNPPEKHYNIADLTPEIVENEIVSFLHKIF
jgi:hypothetical protein